MRAMFAAALVVVTSSSSAPPLECATAVVGGGWAGVYAAWRLVVDSAAIKPADVCLFEARSAVGGRTYSVDVDDLTLDIGAYRFAKGMHLPSDLILSVFQLNISCYEPSCTPNPEFNETLYKIVDAEGHNAGYATPIRAMLKQLEAAGARIYYQHELTGIYDVAVPVEVVDVAPPKSALHFAGGATAIADNVLLNLPRVALERLDPASVLFGASPTSPAFQILRNCTPCGGGSFGLAVKVYAIYEDPWWITKLGISEGKFVSVQESPPLVGRYHDGPVRQHGATLGPAALEAVYTFSFIHPEIAWYEPFASNPAEEPLTVTTDPALLGPLHARLMAYHAGAFAKKGLNASHVPSMSKIALGFWTSDQFAHGLTNPASANLHALVKSPSCPREACLHSYTAQSYNALVSRPNRQRPIHLANNDYAWTGDQGVPCCWAEQSLKSVERTLHTEWGLARPSWLDESYWKALVSDTQATVE